MANKIRFKITDVNNNLLYIPDETGWTLTTKVVKESSTIDISSLITGLATITLEGYKDTVGFIRGVLITCKSKNDTILTTTLIGSIGVNLTAAGWSTIVKYPMYIYTDILNMNVALTFSTDPLL